MTDGWEVVYRANVRWVYRLLFAKVGNCPDAEDLTTEVFITALPRLDAAADVREIRSYLKATARTVLADHWRSAFGREVTTIDPDAAVTVNGPVEEVEDPGPARAERILRQLPERYQAILRLRFLHAYSVKEAAAELGVSVSNAKVLQHRALKLAVKAVKSMEGDG